MAPANSLSEGSSPLCWDVDFLVGSVFTRPGLSSVYGAGVNSQNFVWVKTYQQLSGQTYTLALAADGSLWREDITNNPGVLSLVSGVGILPGSLAHSVTAFNKEFICLHGDIPRKLNGTVISRISQEGPASLHVATQQTTNPNQAIITAWSVSSGVATITANNAFASGEIVQIALPGTPLDTLTVPVLPTGLSSTQFEFNTTAANGSGTQQGTATPLTSVSIASITQPAVSAGIAAILWSAGPGSPSAGNTITFYYSRTQDTAYTTLTNAFNKGLDVYVYLTNLPAGMGFTTATFKVTDVGLGLDIGAGHYRYYFTVTAPSSSYNHFGGAPPYGNFQMTMATVTVATPVPGIDVGSSVSIQGATPANWNNTWNVVQTPNGGVLNITQSSLTLAGVATFTFTLQSGSNPIVGDLVTITGTTNANGSLNVVNAQVASVVGSQFTVAGIATSVAYGTQVESGQAQVDGGIFMIDPGPLYLVGGTPGNPIFGNDTSTGKIALSQSSLSVSSGTRQAVVMFLTADGYLTKASAPFTFTVASNTAAVVVDQLPIGPPNVVARWIAFTEAGANGVPGAFFYVIPNPVQTIVNGQPYTYAPTVINDNTTTSASFTFIDSVLLSSLEIDIDGGNQFNQIELGSSRWCIEYSDRMFYGLADNKITNFVNMSFNGGYFLQVGQPPQPAGWKQDINFAFGVPAGQLVTSQEFGQSLYILNNTGSTQATFGVWTQGAFEDAYNVPIIQPTTKYGVRAALRIPSGLTTGNFVVELIGYDTQSGYGTSYGSFTVPFSSLTTSLQLVTGNLLTNSLVTVPSDLVLRIYTTGIANGADVELDRLEIYDLSQPVLTTQLLASYVNNPEAIDGVTGNLFCQATNFQSINGAFVMYDQLYLLKQDSMFSTQDSPGSEPSGWRVQEVSNIIGACGPEAYDVGEEWAVMACRRGVYVFYGRQPIKISQEIFQVWEQIYWPSASKIWVRNDTINRRILIGVPMITPNPYLPNAPANATPATPNVVLMLNYQGLGDVTMLADGEQMHTTMFGTLMSVDMRRKWTMWQIASPFANFILQKDGFSRPLYICNGNASGKIYQLLSTQLSDDGTAINSLYTTYGFVDTERAKQYPLLGFHRKIWTYMQTLLKGTGACTFTFLQNNLIPALPFSPTGISLPPITLAANPADDYERPLGTPGQGPGVAGNRLFVQVSTNAVGAWFHLERLILVGSAAPLTLRGNAAQ